MVSVRGLAWAAAALAVLLLAAFALYRSGVFTGETVEDRTRLAAGIEAPAEVPPQSAAPATPTASAPAPAAPVPAPRQVVLTAIEPVWLRIYAADGTTLFQGEMTAGQTYEVPQTTPAPMVRLGRAEAVRVTVGGVEAPPLGPPARTLRDVSLAPDARLPAPAPAAAATQPGAILSP